KPRERGALHAVAHGLLVSWYPIGSSAALPWLLPAKWTSSMTPIALLLNLLWLFFGGLWMGAAWVLAGLIMAITIIGLPWTRAAFSIAAYTLFPFGFKAVSREEHFGQADVGTGPLGTI